MRAATVLADLVVETSRVSAAALRREASAIGWRGAPVGKMFVGLGQRGFEGARRIEMPRRRRRAGVASVEARLYGRPVGRVHDGCERPGGLGSQAARCNRERARSSALRLHPARGCFSA